MRFFMEFHEQGSFVRSLNAIFLVLIPKKGGSEDLKDFRPIILVGVCINARRKFWRIDSKGCSLK